MALTYKAPLRDIRFLINEVFNYPEHYKTLKSGENADPETVDMMLESVAGGLLVLLIAIGMMNGAGNIAKPNVDNADDVQGLAFQGTKMAVVPLSIPMIIGPGGISTVIIYAASGNGWGNKIALLVAGFIISVILYGTFMAAGRVSKFLGETGLNVLNRVMGMLLAAVAVEIIVAGLRSLFPQLA